MTTYTIFWKGQQHLVEARDRLHAKLVAYVTIWPESKWCEIR